MPHSAPKLPVKGDQISPVANALGSEGVMKNGLIRFANNQRLQRAAHWTMFSAGALSLTFSILATAASAF